jgi:hypothetical protein
MITCKATLTITFDVVSEHMARRLLAWLVRLINSLHYVERAEVKGETFGVEGDEFLDTGAEVCYTVGVD